MAPPAERRHRAVELTTKPGAVIAVAMSGGVDSSTAAASCVEAGHDVFGIMLRLWSEAGSGVTNRCCTLGAIDDAREVATRLGIPFHVIDVRDVFKELVVDAFTRAVADGETPNPCFICNRQIRFGHLLRHARALGADKLATGHYARVARAGDGCWQLLRGVDQAKDQSYMLYRLGQEELAHALFPLGELTKTDVRRRAAQLGLPVAERPESVDLCWVGEEGVVGFLSRNLASGVARPGPIVDLSGAVVGRHQGLPYFTLGQRRGLGIALGERAYVVRRDFEQNTLVVGPSSALRKDTVWARNAHWISGRSPSRPTVVTAQVRYKAVPARAVVRAHEQGWMEVRFDEPQRAPATGQGLVVYQGDQCLGGGIIAAR